jgi:hypothetical protein
MMRRNRIRNRRGWLPICGALLAALVLEPEAARAGDDLLQRQQEPGEFGHSTSLLELVMPAKDAPTRRAALRRPAPPATTPVPLAPLAIWPGTDRPASGEPVIREKRIPIRLDARAVLGLNDLFLDPARSVLEQKDPLFGRNAEQIDRLDFGDRKQEPISERSRIEKPEFAKPGWFGEHVDLDLSDGISYRTHFEWRDMHLGLKIWGPLVKGDPGLGVRLRGLRLGEHPVEMRARATTDLQDLQVRIDF